jgi:uncharacterized repeat protein (TIGR01451 family)
VKNIRGNFKSSAGRRRSIAAVCALVLAAGLAFAATASQAAPQACTVAGGFEIDGDMTPGTATCVPAGDDWSNVNPSQTSQGGTYQTSHKDSSDPSNWTSSGSTPSKTDFSQAYATSRVVNGHFYAFVAWERDATAGTQGYVIEIDNSTARVAADGTPQPNRNSGGFAFFLSATGGSAPVFDHSCHFASQATYTNTCSNSSTGFTGANNANPFTDPLTNTLQPAKGFFEIALDVTALTGIAPSCPAPNAATVYLRSVTGQLNNGNLKGYMAPLSVAPDSTCVTPHIDTTASGTGAAQSAGSAQRDTVTVGGGANPVGVGTVKFFLCSPTDVAANGGDCSAGGAQVGTAVTLDGNGQATSTPDVTGATSPNDNANGTYCWRAEFTPGANDHNYFPGSHTNNGSECFTVFGGTPSVSTQIQVGGGDPPNLGFTTLGDTATLSPLFNGFPPNGTDGETVDFKLYGPYASGVTPDCQAAQLIFTTSGTLSGGSATTSQTYTPTAAGTYVWIASYAKQDPFNLAASGACSDANESATVLAPDLGITKTADNATVNAGDQIGFTISVSNSNAAGTGTAKNVTINDPLPAGPGVDWSIDPVGAPASCAINGAAPSQTLVCGPDDLTAGASESVHVISGTDSTSCGAYQNTATANADNIPAPIQAGDSTTVQCPALTLTKTADNASVNAGDQIGFTITAANGNAAGTGTATGVTIDDPLPAGSGVDWSTDPAFAPANCTINGAVGAQTLNCTAVDLAPGASETVHIVSSTDKSSCQAYPNVATLAANANHPQLQANDTTTVLCSDVSITKTADHSAPVNAGSLIGFTVEVKNTGAGAANGVVLNDPLPAGSGTGVTWAIDPAVGTPAQFVLAGAPGAQTLSLASGTLPAGADYTVHITAATSQTECSGAYDNTATLTLGNGTGPAPAHATEACAFRVDLAVTKTGSPATQDLGQGNITWTMVVTNNGPDTDTGVKIADPMPSGNTFVSATTTQGTCTGGPILNCNLGTMAAGATVTITLVTTPSLTGTQTNTVTVVGDRPEMNTANNQATATVNVTAPIKPPAPVYCVAVSKITPNQLFVGRKTALTIHLTKHGQPAAGVRVLIKGPKLNMKTKASNARGIVKATIKMKKAGIDTFIPLASKHCNTKRVGVTGVFTPPVTG